MATSHNGDEERRTAELTDDGELLPPTVRVEEFDVPAAVVEAVEAAISEEPNAADAPVLMDPERFNVADHAVAVLGARYNELPVSTGDGPEDFGWQAPYQAREDFDAALTDALPDGLTFEAKNSHQTTIYREGGR